MKLRVVVLLLVFGAVLPTLAAAQEPGALRGSLLGCWRMYRQFNEPATGSMVWVPSVARLDSAGAGSSGGVRVPVGSGELVRLDLAGTELNAERRLLSHWRVDSDSAYLRFSSGFAGTEFVLALGSDADTLVGRAHGWGDDNGRRVDYGWASAVRVRCPEPTANPNGWTPEQLELAARRSADSTCITWRAAREQPDPYRGVV